MGVDLGGSELLLGDLHHDLLVQLLQVSLGACVALGHRHGNDVAADQPLLRKLGILVVVGGKVVLQRITILGHRHVVVLVAQLLNGNHGTISLLRNHLARQCGHGHQLSCTEQRERNCEKFLFKVQHNLLNKTNFYSCFPSAKLVIFSEIAAMTKAKKHYFPKFINTRPVFASASASMSKFSH